MPTLAAVAPFLICAGFIVVSAFIAVMALVMSGVFGFAGVRMGGPLGGGIALVPAFMALMPAGFVVLGVVMFRNIARCSPTFATPTESHPALIVGKRTQVSGGGRNSSASTSYFFTAQFEDGRREELALMTPDLYSRVSEGDAGCPLRAGPVRTGF
ncbi:MAG: DUF2500 family protein [Chloroflexi bacterium]|nr:DUF2500 family protein [Chloroflexota bacterium]